MLSRNKKFAVIILAAGNSTRMGQDKAFLEFSENQTFIDKILSEYSACNFSKIVIVANNNNFNKLKSYENEKIQVTVNTIDPESRFASIKTGCEKVKNFDFVFLQNIDNPFINKKIIQKLKKNSEPSFITIPRHKNKGGHPIVLNSTCIYEILNQKTYNQNFRTFVKLFPIKNVNFTEKEILININTIEEYKHLKNPKYEKFTYNNNNTVRFPYSSNTNNNLQ